MGMNCSFVVLTPGDARATFRALPALDTAAADTLATELFGNATYVEDSDMVQAADPATGLAAVAVWGEVAIVATQAAAVDEPSTLGGSNLLDVAAGRNTYLFSMSSSVDWGAFAWWDTSRSLRRSISANTDDGIIENIGPPLDFERTLEPLDEEYPLDFHPLELVESALAATLGFIYEGFPPPDSPSPEAIPVRVYRVGTHHQSAAKPAALSMRAALSTRWFRTRNGQ